MELNNKLKELNQYSSELSTNTLNKRIYELDLNESYLSGLTEPELQYIHVKLHNSLAYKKPFAPIETIKSAHDRMIKFLSSHTKIDKLDE